MAWIVTWTLASLASMSSASASPLLELTGGLSHHPFTSAALGDDASVTYANPARLTRTKSGSFFGVLAIGQDLSIGLDPRPSGTDITEAVYKARLIGQDGTLSPLTIKPLATEDLHQARGSFDPSGVAAYFMLGTVVPLFDGLATLGFQVTLPFSDFERQSPFFVDEREQFFSNSLHFEMLEDRLEGNAMAVALAGRVLPSLALGAGVSMVTVSEADSEVFIGDPTYTTGGYINPHVRIGTLFVPHAGLSWEPSERWGLHATAHLAGAHEVEGKSSVQLWSYPYPEGEQAIDQPFSMVYRYQPLRLGLVADLRGPEGPEGARAWEVALGARWSQWSTYQDRQGERPHDVWADTIEWSAGGGMRLGSQRLGLDARYTPSPVPDQVGRSSYVDNDRVGLGLSWALDLPGAWSLGLQGQLHALLRRETTKSLSAADPVIDEFPDSADIKTGDLIESSQGLQSNSPGFPGFFSEGWIWTGGLVLRKAL